MMPVVWQIPPITSRPVALHIQLAIKATIAGILGYDCFRDGTVVDARAPYIEEFNMVLVIALNDCQGTNVC